MNYLVLLLAFLPFTAAFFNLGGGCNCPQVPACAPPTPPCPPVQPCAVARGAKTLQLDAPAKLDDLDMRAVAFGIPITNDNTAPLTINQLEKLADQLDTSNNEATTTPNTKQSVDSHVTKGEDADLFLRHVGSEIRRSPVINVVNNPEVTETTTVAAEVNTNDKIDPNNDKCNSQTLQKLMIENMSDNSSESKRKINVAAETKFGGSVDVICSRGHFSYVFSSNLYCEATKGLTTCIAFRQAV